MRAKRLSLMPLFSSKARVTSARSAESDQLLRPSLLLNGTLSVCPRIAILLGISANEAAISLIKLAALPCMLMPPLGNMAKSALSMISIRRPCLSRVTDTWSFRPPSFLFSDNFCSISFSSLSKSAFSCAWAISFFCSGVSLSGSE